MSRKLAAALICGATLIAMPAVAQTAKPDFVTQQSSDEWRASKLVGVNVYGADNQKIGDINEVLLDKSGTAKAVVIGVGGFLGMGQKNVAIPFSALTWEGRSATTGTSNTGAGGTSTGMTGATANSAASSAERGYPDHAVIQMSKADLQNAPDFKFASDTSSSSNSAGTGNSTGMGTGAGMGAGSSAAPATSAPAGGTAR
jgi:sporulation protein YlmC with PRC-barrel domain